MLSFDPKTLTEKELAERWTFPWDIMEVLLEGKSSVDLSVLEVGSETDAQAFLKSYGFDPERLADQRKMHAVLIEALYFIERYLMPDEWRQGRRPPKEIVLCDDPAKLLLWASDKNFRQKKRRAWACAILKVMHTITHIDALQRLNNLQVARTQIMGKFQKALFRDKQGRLCFGEKDCAIELEKVEWKHVKPRHSIILKLLHKPGNVAENIFDLLGVRIVTKTLSDTMMVVKFLRQFYLVDFPNVHPARARNNLIDMKRFQVQCETLRQDLLHGRITPALFEKKLAKLAVAKSRDKFINPHSASNYRAIQLTCRQRVRYPNPMLTWQDKVKHLLEDGKLGQDQAPFFTGLLASIKRWQRGEDHSEIAIYFPFEVQVLDKTAALSVEEGEASHIRYKSAQVRTARRRILHEILGNLPS